MEAIGVVALLFTMVVTAADVVMGMFKRPIMGAYDLAGIGSGIAISFAVAITSWKKQHIEVDTIFQKLPTRVQSSWDFMLQIINTAVFAVISVYLFKLSASYRSSGEVCGTLPSLSLWPIALFLGCACLVQCLVAVSRMINILKEGGEHE
jgi:TRAP-type C4-dicarboxylate transport system permease small subunit